MAHKIKLLILDIDGVLTDGTKIYDINHKTIYKKFQDKDFTAIKRLKAAGIKVIFLSGDNWNKGLAKKRVIDFYLSRGLYADKEKYLPYFKKKYSVLEKDIAYVGDDFFDLNIMKKVKYSFCTADAPQIIKRNCNFILKSLGGQNVICEIYETIKKINKFKDPSFEEVIDLDNIELSTTDMKK